MKDAPSVARRAAYGLTILTLINGVNYLDRYVSSGVLDQIQGAFRLSSFQAGLITTVFVLVYMVAAPLGGRLGDTGSRRYLIAGSIFLWSLATFASGLAPNFTTFLIARALIGLGEAGYATVAPAVISDLYSPERRTRMMSVFYVALPVGSALGFLIGGWVGQHYSWHSAFFVGGVPGIALAALSLFMPEPPRGAMEKGGASQEAPPQVTFKQGVRTLLPNRVFWICTAGLTLMTFSIGGLATWMPTFLKLERGMSGGRAGLLFGGVTALAGIAGTLAGGELGARAERRSPLGGLWVSGLGLVLAAPFMMAAAWARAELAIFAAIFVAKFLVFLNTGPLNAAIMTFVPVRLRAFAMGLNVLFIHLLGDAFSSPVIGAVRDLFNLERAIVLNALPVLLGGVVLLVGASKLNSRSRALEIR